MVIDQTALRLGLRIKKNKRALKIEIEKKTHIIKTWISISSINRLKICCYKGAINK
jgi:hypothetical protein